MVGVADELAVQSIKGLNPSEIWEVALSSGFKDDPGDDDRAGLIDERRPGELIDQRILAEENRVDWCSADHRARLLIRISSL